MAHSTSPRTTTARSRTVSSHCGPVAAVVRCAIYTRKSTEEGLEQEFNTLHAQRLAGENFIRSQAGEGWEVVPEHYDDGGFSGSNMERPALQRLLADIDAGKIDCIITYKVDRLSRSLLDFGKMMETFDKQGVSFVSVTQQLNTASSMGRLTLNILLSFSQFEREIISERTRDKIAAARRQGKWVGGMPLLGYRVDNSKLVVEPEEAGRVRAMFDLYLERQSLLAVIRELDARGWVNKCWTTRKGVERGGKPFTKTSLHKLLTNITYVGKLRYKDEIHPGEHAAIVDAGIWERVQTQLQRNGRSGGVEVRNQFGALLKGLLRCVSCDSAMTPTHTTKDGHKRYRYYVCCRAQQRGWQNCPSPSIPAAEIERFVVVQIRGIGRNPELIRETVIQARRQAELQLTALETERSGVERTLVRWHAEIRDVVAQVGPGGDDSPALARLADLQDRVRRAERRATEIQALIGRLERTLVEPEEVATALAQFDPLWDALTPQEQCRLVGLLVERVDYDGARSKVAVTFRPAGFPHLVTGQNNGEVAE